MKAHRAALRPRRHPLGLVALAAAATIGFDGARFALAAPGIVGTPEVCAGDCGSNKLVTVDEIITLLNVALGQLEITACPYGVPNSAGVDVSVIVQAVSNALTSGCSAARRCEALRGMTTGGARIISANLTRATPSYPEHCKVRGRIAPQLNFEVRLPTTWSGRALFIGGGGLNGFIPAPETVMFNPSIAQAGYVTIASDSGHQASFLDGSWALDDPPAVENFAYLATHTVLSAARGIVSARYGREVAHTYFIGASQGGREALIAAQRWPADFDGLIALEPVYDITALTLALNRVAQRVFIAPGARLSLEKVSTLANAVLDACDDLDGLADGIIGNVAACQFDPVRLRCAGEDSDGCLTDAQIETVNTIHGEMVLDFALANDVQSYPGWPTGHESVAFSGGWPLWIVGASADPSSSQGFVLSDQTLRFLVANDADLETLPFDANAYESELVAFSTLADATDADLSAFAARDGKLILWHGLADYAVSPRSTVRYYDQVVSTLGGQEAADDFIRFYTSPGVDHLNFGPGAGTIDFLGALTAWVETGMPPGDLIAAKTDLSSSAPLFTRPLCRYPHYPRYDGSGDPASASSFQCVPP